MYFDMIYFYAFWNLTLLMSYDESEFNFNSFRYYFVIAFQTLNFAVVFKFEYFNVKRVTE